YVPARKTYFVESHLRDLGVLAGQIEAEVSVRSEAAARLIAELGPGASCDTEQVKNRFNSINLACASCDDGAGEKRRRGGQVTAAPAAKRSGESTTSLRPGNTTAAGWPSLQIESTLTFRDEISREEASSEKTCRAKERSICPTASLSDIVRPLLDSNDVADDDIFLANGTTILYQHGRRSLRLGS